ncbi:MAG: holo-[acyl-carrier-protein] synthase [Nitrospirae bacterium]|nr:MAG: holo-[acyl-carrier-protein] synthase [Nitrospirota bacterium]
MILGIGTDIVEISRIKSSVEKWGDTFLKRIFSPDEIAYCSQNKNPYPCFAGRFAAKESVIKAFGGLSKLGGLRDIEILNEPSGRPYVRLSSPLDSGLMIHLSVSHEKGHAIASAVLERKSS